MSVYKAINLVQADLAKSGISKDSENTFDRYKFRGIDAVYNHLAPLLAKHGLCILPRMISRTCEERASQKGGALFYVTVEAEFDLVSAEDGSKHTIRTFGEAMDRGDKATNKAMSAAYKYAAFQAFAIPTEGDNDADSTTHEVKASAPRHTPTSGSILTPEQKAQCETAVIDIRERMDADDVVGAFEIYQQFTDSEERTAIWSKLSATNRRAIKAHGETIKEPS